MADQIGRLVDGRYAVEGVLGSGGMGVVLRARHKFTGAEVALKLEDCPDRVEAWAEVGRGSGDFDDDFIHG